MKILKLDSQEELESVVLELLRCGVHFNFVGDLQVIIYTDKL